MDPHSLFTFSSTFTRPIRPGLDCWVHSGVRQLRRLWDAGGMVLQWPARPEGKEAQGQAIAQRSQADYLALHSLPHGDHGARFTDNRDRANDAPGTVTLVQLSHRPSLPLCNCARCVPCAAATVAQPGKEGAGGVGAINYFFWRMLLLFPGAALH